MACGVSTSDPVVSYRETVAQASSVHALSQSPSSTAGSAPRGGPWASSCPRPSTTAPSPAAVGAPLGPEDRELPGKPLLNTAVHKGLSAADALLEMPVLHLPSPVEAQQYRVGELCTGPLDDEAVAIRSCDAAGPATYAVDVCRPGRVSARVFDELGPPVWASTPAAASDDRGRWLPQERLQCGGHEGCGSWCCACRTRTRPAASRWRSSSSATAARARRPPPRARPRRRNGGCGRPGRPRGGAHGRAGRAVGRGARGAGSRGPRWPRG
jgi:hypothetical protein